MLGVLFGLLSAASFGLNNSAIRRGVLTATVSQGLYITVLGGVPLFIIAALVSGQVFHIGELGLAGVGLFVAAGLIHFLLGRYSNYRTVNALGANGATPLRSMAPLFAVIMAVLFLGESLTALHAVGIGLVILAPLVLLQRRKARPAASAGSAPTPPAGGAENAARSGIRPAVSYRWAEGFFWGVLTSVGYGSSPLLIRAALDRADLGLAGGMISYCAASLVLLVGLALPGRATHVRSVPRGALKWFSFGAVLVFFAQMFRYLALGVAPVTVVTPLQQTGSVWTILFSFLINRRTEMFNSRVLIAIVISVTGTVALVWPQ